MLLFAARDGEVRRFEAAGLAELRLAGLGAEAAGALLAEHVPSPLSPEVRDRLVESAGGNPLALIELRGPSERGAACRPRGAAGSAPAERGDRARLSRARARACRRRRSGCSCSSRPTTPAAWRPCFEAAATLGIEPDALDAAEAAGLVRAFDGGVEFRHPLVRSTLYRDATFAQRQAVHRALADVFDGEQDADRRAWHRAAASPGQDDEVADELEQAARRARRRSGFAAAARALERAAELSSDDEARGRRLVAAAQDAWLAGGPEQALALLDRADGLVSDLRRPRRRDASPRHDRAAVRRPGGGRDDPRRRRRRGRRRRSRRRRSRCSSRPPRPPRTPATPRRSSSSAGARRRCSSDDDPDQRFTVDVDRRDRQPARRRRGERCAAPAGGARARRRLPGSRAAWCMPARVPATSGRRRPSTSSTVARSPGRARAGAVAMLPYVLEFLARAEAVDGRYAAAAAHASRGASAWRTRRASRTRSATCTPRWR